MRRTAALARAAGNDRNRRVSPTVRRFREVGTSEESRRAALQPGLPNLPLIGHPKAMPVGTLTSRDQGGMPAFCNPSRNLSRSAARAKGRVKRSSLAVRFGMRRKS